MEKTSENETAKKNEAEAPKNTEQAMAAEVPPEEVVTTEQQLKEAQEAAEDFKRKWYSVTAEYENYRKRTALTRQQSYAEGKADVVSKLFPIADNLDRALQSCQDEKTKKGISMVISSFEKVLEEEKIEVICPVGEEFSAEKCEAILAVEAEAGEVSGTVKQVFLKGYEQNGKVLRFAQVSVVK